MKLSRRREAGFSLPGLMIAVTIMGLMLVPIMELGEGAMRYYARLETENRLKDLQSAITQAYSQNMSVAENTSGQSLTLLTGTLNQVLPATYAGGTSRVCASNSTTFQMFGQWLKTSPSKAYTDGTGLPLCVFITPRLTITINDINVMYHVIAIVAAGRDGYVSTATTLNSSTGVLTLGGDDRGVIIDGKQLAVDKYTITVQRMQAIVNALNTYFTSRYMGNSSRNTSIDYFTALSDTSGIIPDTGGSMASMYSLGIAANLGLSKLDIIDGYGNYFLFDNSSSAVRSPSNSNTNMQSPPYTAQVSATLPGNRTLTMSAIGSY